MEILNYIQNLINENQKLQNVFLEHYQKNLQVYDGYIKK